MMPDTLGTPHPLPSAASEASSETSPQLPAGLRLGQVRLQVGDLDRSIDYYTSVLGLQIRERDTDRAALGALDDEHPLVELEARPETAPLQAHSRQGLYHFALLVPDRAGLGRFLEHLSRTGTRIGASDHLVSEAIYLRDPDGLGIEVYADRSRASWRRSHGELAMSTAPLDAESLLAAADGEPWAGMPSGTVMGHLHLHVGDLDTASHFYHNALGLDRTVWSYPGALFLSAGGYHHHLGLNTWAGRQAPPPSERDARLLEWRIVLPTHRELLEVVGRMSATGHEVVSANSDWIVTDPWGTRLRLTGD
jgi:catechol 2,3-dioxygenase